MMAENKSSRSIHSYSSEESYRDVIGCDLIATELNMDDGTLVKLHIWSLSDQKRFDDRRPQFMKGSTGALVVYFPKAYDTGTNDPAIVQKLVREFDEANYCRAPIVLLITGDISRPNLPSKSVNINPRVVADLATDPPAILRKDERDSLVKITAGRTNIKVVEAGSDDEAGLIFALTLLSEAMNESVNSQYPGVSNVKKTSGAFDYLHKIVLLGDEQGVITGLLKKRLPKGTKLTSFIRGS